MLRRNVRLLTIGLAVCFALVTVSTAVAGDRLLIGEKKAEPITGEENFVRLRGITTEVNTPVNFSLQREKPWSLPRLALSPDADSTIHCLVLRYNFQYETTDNPNTTGRGHMNLSRPLTAADSAAYYDSAGHWIDPPPHDSVYFDAHMRALNNYWNYVSEDHIDLTWDIYPPVNDSVFQLPYEMSHYGLCDSVVVGLERYFVDCIHLADSADIIDPGHPDIDFSQYQAIFLFHAGSDRQNDIGFPETCNDLFTGFIKFGDSVAVNDGAGYVRTALMMPETSCQDNRATALNAVLAHEFGHQLGLVDLYNTRNFLSLMGDFALMDNNGFGTGIDFGFDVGKVFGAIPLYASAWSRAFLGFTPVVDFRKGDDIRLVAAEVMSEGIKIARVPISENEYYLIENRSEDTDGKETGARADSATNVILGPVNFNKEFTGEYDFLMPGSGMVIYRVDESVAALDYDGDGQINFEDNDLQLDPDRLFIKLMEADGLVNFGGYYRSGFGKPEDLFREDRADRFTPGTNPPAVDNSGNNTRVYITDIRRDTSELSGLAMDTVMRFDVATDKLVDSFPIRAGYPVLGLSPLADDLNGDGNDEIIVASADLLSVVTCDGQDFLRQLTGVDVPFYDVTISTVNPRTTRIPLYAQAPGLITAGPVTGDFGHDDLDKYIAVGCVLPGGSGQVYFYSPVDANSDGRADPQGLLEAIEGMPLALSFGDMLYLLTDEGMVYRWNDVGTFSVASYSLPHDEYHGICRINDRLVVLAGDSLDADSLGTSVHVIADTVYTYTLPGRYAFGPIIVDVNRDALPELVVFTADGEGLYLTIDTTTVEPSFSILAHRATGYPCTVNPIAGDIDLDGRADIMIGGVNAVYAFNHELTLKTGYPREVDDRYAGADVIAAPVLADIDRGGAPELVFPNEVGNLYSFGDEITYGFPLSAGEMGTGSALLFNDSTGGKLAYLGADGWFYAWHVDADAENNFWPMGGHDPAGTFALDVASLPDEVSYSERLPEDRFFVYPNPVTDGFTTIRYFLGEDASSATLTIHDLSGYEVASFSGPVSGGVDNEFVWECSDITPGVYRCLIKVDFGGDTQKAFTDIAVIR